MKKLLIMAVALGSTIPAAAAAELKGPVPAAPMQAWIGASDPVQMPKGETVVGPLNFALTISPDGGVIRCTVERSSGSASLDDQTCEIFAKRGQFRPAVDSAGKPVIGVYRVVALWAAPGRTASAPPLVEMGVSLQAMPEGLSNPAYVDIAVSVDEAGKVDGCAVGATLSWAGQPIADRQAAGKVLGATACAQAVGTLKLEAAKNATGQAVRSVQMATALFTAKAAPLDPKDIVVSGKREVKIVPTKGFIRIVDYQAIGPELVLVQTSGGGWYRMELEPPCIGNSRLTRISSDNAGNARTELLVDHGMMERLPRDLRDALDNQMQANAPPGPNGGIILPAGVVIEEGLGFTNRSDGSVSRGDEVVATTIESQNVDIVHIDSCRISSLVPSDPPATKSRKKAPAAQKAR